MFLLLLVACGVTVRPTCTETRTEVTDDEVTSLGFSAADVLAVVVGEHVEDGEYEDGTAATVTATIARAEGSAELALQEEAELEQPSGTLFGRTVLDIAVECTDYVAVPVTLAIATNDGAVAFSTEAAEASAGHPDRIEVDARPSLDEMDGVPPSEEEAESGFADAQFLDGAMAGGRLGWQGSTETSSWAEYTVLWGSQME